MLRGKLFVSETIGARVLDSKRTRATERVQLRQSHKRGPQGVAPATAPAAGAAVVAGGHPSFSSGLSLASGGVSQSVSCAQKAALLERWPESWEPGCQSRIRARLQPSALLAHRKLAPIQSLVVQLSRGPCLDDKFDLEGSRRRVGEGGTSQRESRKARTRCAVLLAANQEAFGES